MSLRIYNTLTRALEDFSPIEPGHVRMYVCGITVYDLCHVGHARANVAFDIVQRWIKAGAYRLTFVRNITDIEDKIIRRAVENGETVRQSSLVNVTLNEPATVLPPDRVIALTTPPAKRPNSADTPDVETVVSCSESSMNSGIDVRRTLSCATTPLTRIRFSEVIAPEI